MPAIGMKLRGTSAALLFIVTLFAGMAHAVPKPDLWAFWAENKPTSTALVDHSDWQEFLNRYLHVGPDGINRVDYAAVNTEDRQLLGDYLDTLTNADPRQLTRNRQLAYWINLYNALTVEVVLRHPDKGSILRMGMGLLSIGPWDDPLATVAGEVITLNDIEHRILRPIWQDHRIHYAVNCASLGCPNLSGTAYTADNLEAQLTQAETAYINHPRGVSFTERGKLRLSSIYKWYREDFADSTAALLIHLAERHRTLSTEIREYSRGIEYKYDWKPNRH
jgi:hypothetical protein